MFEKTSKLAEELATSVSRRGFLGSLGRWAGATSLGLAGVLSWPGSARADGGHKCCFYTSLPSRFVICVNGNHPCPPPAPYTALDGSGKVSNCNVCRVGGPNQ